MKSKTQPKLTKSKTQWRPMKRKTEIRLMKSKTQWRPMKRKTEIRLMKSKTQWRPMKRKTEIRLMKSKTQPRLMKSEVIINRLLECWSAQRIGISHPHWCWSPDPRGHTGSESVHTSIQNHLLIERYWPAGSKEPPTPHPIPNGKIQTTQNTL